MCTRCRKNEIEGDGHILARCSYNKDLITKKHNNITNKTAKELVKNNPTARIWKERSWNSYTELMRLDITMVQGNRAMIIEVTIPYEMRKEYIERRRSEKINKYQQLLQKEVLHQVDCDNGQVIPTVIGALGTINESTNQDLRSLKLQQQRDALQMIVTTGTVNILNNHFKRHDFDREQIIERSTVEDMLK